MERFETTTDFAVSRADLWCWHAAPGAFGRLIPPGESIEVSAVRFPWGKTARHREWLREGAEVTFRMRAGPLRFDWVASHEEVVPGSGFTDVQRRGPFADWRHRHIFEQPAPGRSRLRDRIDYRLPGGPWLGRLASGLVREKLERVFRYRHEVTLMDLQRRPTDLKPLRILVTGGNGFLGRHLRAFLTTRGHTVRSLGRRPGEPEDLVWDPAAGRMPGAELKIFDAVIHLAGENLTAHRWTPDFRERLRRSRIDSTRLLAETLARLDGPPGVLVTASGVNAYPADGRLHEEAGPAGQGFLSELCRDWEAAARPAQAAGWRVVHARLAAVLSPDSGALAKLLPVFRSGLGGPVGSGRQHFSWIALDDALEAFAWCVERSELAGPVNLVAPEVVSQATFAKTLGRVLRRPAVVPTPAWAVRAVLGPMADETVLADLAAAPGRLRHAGYGFRYPMLEDALRHLLD